MRCECNAKKCTPQCRGEIQLADAILDVLEAAARRGDLPFNEVAARAEAGDALGLALVERLATDRSVA